MKKEKRKKDVNKTKRFELRLTEIEFRLLQRQEQESGMARSELIRKRIFGGTVQVPVNWKELLKSLDAVGTELGRSGNNINQLARHANTLNKYGALSGEIVRQFIPLLEEFICQQLALSNQLRQLLRAMGKR